MSTVSFTGGPESFTSTATDSNVIPHITSQGHFPYEPQMQRVILDVPDIYDILGIEVVKNSLSGMKDSNEYRKKGSSISLPESELRQLVQDSQTLLVESVVVAVGNLKEINLIPGDRVMIFLNQMESSVKAGGKEYRIYNERSIICKVA
jgi:co-chaperonin GroES (HSP10)